MTNQILITKVKRIKDNKIFELNDPVEVEGLHQGIITGFNQFKDDFRVCLDDGSDANEGIYYSIDELD